MWTLRNRTKVLDRPLGLAYDSGMSNSLSCPACHQQTVPVPSFSFTDTSVDVKVCDDCQMTGLISVRIRKSWLIDLQTPTYSVRHRDGLVTFSV